MQKFDEHWQLVIPKLVDAYVQWRYGNPDSEDPEVLPSDADVVEIEVLDLSGTQRSVSIKRCATRSLMEDLALSGYLGTAPLHPSFAISFKTLEHFRIMRLFKASWSVEAFARMLCYQYYVCSHVSTDWQVLMTTGPGSLPPVLPHRHRRCVRRLSEHPPGSEEAGDGSARARCPRVAREEWVPRMRVSGTIEPRDCRLLMLITTAGRGRGPTDTSTHRRDGRKQFLEARCNVRWTTGG